MKIFLITPSKERSCMWQNTLQIAVPEPASTYILTPGNWLNEIKHIKTKEQSILLIVNYHELLNDDIALAYIKEHDISIICIDNAMQNIEPAQLIQKGVKALSNIHISIEKIRDVIRIVANGGIYLETSKNE